MIGQGLGRLAMAEKLSRSQLEEAIENKSIPAYIGIPLLEEKIAMEQRMQMARAGMAPQPQMTIEEEVLQKARQMNPQNDGGIDQISIPEPEFAGGGIIAFEGGGSVPRFQNQGAVLPIQTRLRLREMMDEQERSIFDRTGTIPERLRSQISAQTPDLRAPVRMEGGRPIPVDLQTGEELGIAPRMEEPEVAPQPSAGIEQISMGPLVQQATSLADAFGGPPTDQVPTIQQASDKTSELLRASGYDEGVLPQIRQDISQQREALSKDKEEARAFRIIEAGLGIMSGTSANAFENIGKGATPALKGLASDIKEIQKAEREFKTAEQNLLIKQNEAAMGKARVTQASIDKAQDSLDRKVERYNALRGDLAKTLLSGQIQERLARASFGSRMTDFDKKWNIYSSQAKARGETPSTEGFAKAFGVDRGSLTYKDALSLALQDKSLTINEARAEAVKLINEDRQMRGDTSSGMSEQDRQALAWANANPDDPRSKQIKEYLGGR